MSPVAFAPPLSVAHLTGAASGQRRVNKAAAPPPPPLPPYSPASLRARLRHARSHHARSHHARSHHARARPRATLVRGGDTVELATLAAFAESVRGEWTGYEGLFDACSGEAQAVPDFYVPDQFAEWGVRPRGFETNHSVIVRGCTLYRKFFRVLPAVSVFGDHVDLEEELRAHDIAKEPALHVFADGAYAWGASPVVPRRRSELDKWPGVEVCVRKPEGDGRKEAVLVAVRFDFEKREFVGDVRVVKEKWTCIYCDGADIEGSSGYVEGWVVEEAGTAEALAGKWRVEEGGKEDGNDRKAGGDPVIIERASGRAMEARKQLYLPQGIDVGVMEAEEGGGVAVELGWLVDADTRVVMRRNWAEDGHVQSTERVVEYRV